MSDNKFFNLDTFPFFKFVIAKTDDSNITTEESINVHFYLDINIVPSDKTVSEAKLSDLLKEKINNLTDSQKDIINELANSKSIVLANALDHNDLNNLKAMYEALEHENDNLKQLNAKLMLNDVAIKQENTALKEKADSLAQINSKTMLASLQNSKDIAEIKKQLNPESEGGE